LPPPPHFRRLRFEDSPYGRKERLHTCPFSASRLPLLLPCTSDHHKEGPAFRPHHRKSPYYSFIEDPPALSPGDGGPFWLMFPLARIRALYPARRPRLPFLPFIQHNSACPLAELADRPNPPPLEKGKPTLSGSYYPADAQQLLPPMVGEVRCFSIFSPLLPGNEQGNYFLPLPTSRPDAFFDDGVYPKSRPPLSG